MAETNPRVMDMVRRELDRDPSQSSEALYEKAKKVDRGIGSLSIRQFHARYPLQVKRIAAAEKRRGGGRKAATRKGATRKRTGRKGTARKKTARKKTAKKTRRGRASGTAARPSGARKATRGRKRAVAKATGRRTAKPADARASGDTDVRAVLLAFAQEVAAAEGKADVIGVVGRVDTWVDRIRKVSG